MAEEKKKRGKRAYLNDFYQDVSGKYVYRGKMYSYDGPLPRKSALGRAWLYTGVAAAALLANGFVPNPALNGCFYVVIPYVLGLIAACSTAWALGRITAAGEQLRAYVYEETAQQLPMRCTLALIGSAAGAAGQILYLLLHGLQQGWGLMLVFLAFQIAATVALYKLKQFKFETFWRIL